MAGYEYRSKRTWAEWLRLGIEVLFATIIFAVWIWMALAATAAILTTIFIILGIGTAVVAARLSYLEGLGARYRLTEKALEIRAPWFMEDFEVGFDDVGSVRALDTYWTWPNVNFMQDLDIPNDKPHIYIGWPSREGLVEIQLTSEKTAKYKLPEDFDFRDIIQAVPWSLRRRFARFNRIILSVDERDSFIRALEDRARASTKCRASDTPEIAPTTA
ncbi:MAG: hypothetical protein M1548_08960 [Actinobacteria bacterium]|nr:hypothetical protein [Actinomycetota bacterium]